MARRDLSTESGVISSDSLCTPPEIYEPLVEFWGEIGGDPCSNEHSRVPARESYRWGGLHRPWWRRTYMNQPYSQSPPWIDKASAEMKIGRVKELVILCMTATSTGWWKKAMTVPRRNPLVICTKRIKFLGPDGSPLDNGARFDTSLIYYGANPQSFARHFKHVAMWTTRGR